MILHEWMAGWSRWAWPLVVNHLWQATLFSFVALTVVVLLRRAPAKARYAIWLVASAKFVLPSVLLASALNALGFGSSFFSFLTIEPAQSVAVMSQFAEPLDQWTGAEGYGAKTSEGHIEIYCALTLFWLIGCLVLLSHWWRRRHQLSVAVRAGTLIRAGREADILSRAAARLALNRSIGLTISSKIIEPGVWGTRRPSVVLPESMANHLSDAELELVLLHELVHVTRLDNLLSSLHMLLCCLLWFHPVIWLIDRRLLAERERICDEEVIKLTGQSEVYAMSLLKVLRFCLGWKVAGVSYAAGSSIGRRVEQIMADNVNSKLAASHRLLIGIIAVALVIFSIAAGLASRDRVTRFEIEGSVLGGVEGEQSSGVQSESPGQKVPDPNEGLDRAPDLPLSFKNTNNAPITITEATLKVGPRHWVYQKEDDTWTEVADRYVIKPSLRLVNNTNRRIAGMALEFRNNEGKSFFYFERPRSDIAPYGTYTFSRRFMSFTGDPNGLVAKVIGVVFEDATTWGKVPPPPPPPPPPREVPPSQAPPGSAPTSPGPPSASGPADPPGTSSAPLPAPKIVRKAGGVLQGSAIKRVNPVYPQAARDAQVSGIVIVEVIIDEEGNVSSARAVNGPAELREAALDTARQWVFVPTSLEGVPVKVVGTLTFNFTL